MFIDGVRKATGDTRPVHDRWTGAVLGSVALDSAVDVDHAVRSVAARRPALPAEQRARILGRCAELLRQRADEFATRSTAESGVCRRETSREVARACANLEVAAAEAVRLRGEAIPVPGAARLAVTVPEPVGVVAAITPFNRPLNQVVVKLAPAIAAGCTVVLKPSERTPLTALAFAELLLEAGLPAGMLAVVTGDPRTVGPALTGHPLIDMVTFTGSVPAGRAVAAAAAGRKLLLELGGNDPLIVLDDADLDRAASLAADGAFATAGQSCRGIKRVIVTAAVADAFVSRLVVAAAAKRCGDPRDPATDVGPLVDEPAATEVLDRVHAAVAAGARLLLGGTREGALVPPTVLDRVPADAVLVTEETFGPVAPVIRVRDADEAVAVANSTAYGLQAGVLTRDSDAFWRIAERLRVGAVNLGEGPHYDSPHIPFGGVKASGYGREGMRYAIREMSVAKTITVPYGVNDG
ncbi:aldehyde dehydrogenase family protein [Solwaraspora sp. WMMD1047]|uniref:aldehyde dehydrogenase family protein n=1 Tax=Solwaraspora sp. WMMD1047 TaxID=3016102 RepID=UPI002416878E|nr:aldehyde dehydrogenase family protein [Solwaraspora sp. WMMD1047]MDG4834258.1 aldehyde dehydrogenase family protein [Solwaraspora sp. WMMD1047]